MKAIKPSLARTVTSSSKTSSSRILAQPTSSPSKSTAKRSFHSTPQEAAYTRPTMTARHAGYTTQFFTSPPQQTPNQHPYDTRMYSSGSSSSRRSDHFGSPADEDIIEELRPIVAKKSENKGTGKSGADMRAMHTGKGQEWVW